jgi:hypothetical protein
MKAWRVLNDMYQQRPFLETSARADWLLVYEYLAKYLTREAVKGSSAMASRRVEYLEIEEPPPRREEFLPARPPQPISSPEVLADVEQRFERAWHERAAREHWRKQELEYAKSVYERVRAREIAEERAQRIEANRARWPAGADLDDELLDIEDMSVQVDIQNDKIEERVAQLDNLLTYGLLDNPNTTATPTANPKALIALAMLALGGHRPTLPGRTNPRNRQ